LERYDPSEVDRAEKARQQAALRAELNRSLSKSQPEESGASAPHDGAHSEVGESFRLRFTSREEIHTFVQQSIEEAKVTYGDRLDPWRIDEWVHDTSCRPTELASRKSPGRPLRPVAR
jgi:hypothetical protein